jgi:oligopeptide/dipeptide ABC transporter ATP-binding protein
MNNVYDEKRTLLLVSRLTKRFPVRLGLFKTRVLTAVDAVSLSLDRGRTLAMVGESGSGKTTLARAILRLIEPTSGSVQLDGTELTQLKGNQVAELRAVMQMVFQDPQGSLSPWQTVEQTVGEPLELHTKDSKAEIEARVLMMLDRVGLPAEYARRYPHQLSGGQQQRVGISRALITNPSLVVLDEPTSSLDLSVQAQVLSLLKSLQQEMNVAYLFISHDLTAVRYLAHDVAVMYRGRIVEQGHAADVLARPVHPYTQALIAACLHPDRRHHERRVRLRGEIPSALGTGVGCPLFGRCPVELPVCAEMPQQLARVADQHFVACWRAAPGETKRPQNTC